LRCSLGQFDFDRASDVTFAIRRIEAAAPASGIMAAIRLSVPVDDARDTVVTLLFSKRTELDFSVAPQTVRLSGEQGPSEQIPTSEDVLTRAASPIVKLKRNSDNKSHRWSMEDTPSSNRIRLLLANSQSRQVKKL
jgi:hypothetical protein